NDLDEKGFAHYINKAKNQLRLLCSLVRDLNIRISESEFQIQ
ncbi:27637_t:CDS:2, partial [Dentiscutata erythropus]